jgi:CBS domain-containing protein
MWEHNCGALPVTTEEEKLVGIVTDRDICIALGTKNARASDLCVYDLAKNRALTCSPSDDVHTALQMMREGKVRRLPVADEQGRVAGVISRDDLVLNAKPDGKLGSAIAYGDAVTTLQAIYTRDESRGWPDGRIMSEAHGHVATKAGSEAGETFIPPATPRS